MVAHWSLQSKGLRVTVASRGPSLGLSGSSLPRGFNALAHVGGGPKEHPQGTEKRGEERGQSGRLLGAVLVRLSPPAGEETLGPRSRFRLLRCWVSGFGELLPLPQAPRKLLAETRAPPSQPGTRTLAALLCPLENQ